MFYFLSFKLPGVSPPEYQIYIYNLDSHLKCSLYFLPDRGALIRDFLDRYCWLIFKEP